MSTQTWTVHVDGAQREVFVDTDPATGRTAIRVDGRMAGRPMTDAEEEREIAVGRERYVIRRLANGSFDLDKAPPDAASMAAARNGTSIVRPAVKPAIPVGKILSAIVLTAILVVVVPYVRSGIAYLRVPWQPYVHPDRAFRVSVASAPEITAEQTANFRTQKLTSHYRDHAYVLEWADFGDAIPDSIERKVLDDALASIVSRHKATLIKSDYGARSGRGMKSFIAQLPEQKNWSRGTARGEIIVDGARVYILYSYTPEGESLSYDIGEYLRSFELPR